MGQEPVRGQAKAWFPGDCGSLKRDLIERVYIPKGPPNPNSYCECAASLGTARHNRKVSKTATTAWVMTYGGWFSSGNMYMCMYISRFLSLSLSLLLACLQGVWRVQGEPYPPLRASATPWSCVLEVGVKLGGGTTTSPDKATRKPPMHIALPCPA